MAGTGFAETTPYGNLECGRAKSGRRDLMGSQRIARPSLERGMEAASGKKRTPQHEGVTEGREETAENPLPPYNVSHTPLGIRRAGCFLLLCISQTPEMHPLPFFGGFWHPHVVLRKGSPHPQGIRRHPRVRWQLCESKWLLFRTLPCDVAA